LGWYGPADNIAKAAVIVDAFDSAFAQELADDAMGLVEPHVEVKDQFEKSRVDNALSGIVDAFRAWDRERALRAARWLTGSWIHGAGWKTTDGRVSALAVLGLDAADCGDDGRALALLDECLPVDAEAVQLGRADPRYVRGGLFRP